MLITKELCEEMAVDIRRCDEHAKVQGSEALFSELRAKYSLIDADFATDISLNGKVTLIGEETDYRKELGSLASKLRMWLIIHPLQDLEIGRATKRPRVFISHSSIDKEYVNKLVQMLGKFGLPQQEIFCSSLPGHGVPISKNIFDYLRDQFLHYNLYVIFIHSNNYYNSPVSLNEMGAAWALKTNYASILLPGFSFNDMTGVVNNTDISIKLDLDINEVRDKLNQLKQSISDEFGLVKISDIIWEEGRDEFISAAAKIYSERSTSHKSTEHRADSFLLENDLELTEYGYYIKKSENATGKMIRYCAACYQNYGKLYPFTQGSMQRDLFCSNCKAHISR